VNFLSLIEAKRDGQPLADAQIQQIVAGCTAGEIPDYQMAAFLMAVFFRGLSAGETRALTLAMRDSGEVLRFPKDDSRPVVDKHSTGGVGDKVSLPLAPLLACLGLRVPMISGRGLGITGGTLDKLESIPGFTTQLGPERLVRQVQEIGVAMGGQTATMIPADKKIYALRDVTATVPSIPLITASILSKKLAEGLNALVIDVKFGSAAFMPNHGQARALALSLVNLARECGVLTRAIITGMSTPLGSACGNWLEVRESVACLEGRGPADLRQLVIECAAQILVLSGKTRSLDTAREQATACLGYGRAREKWDELLAAQGADLAAFKRKVAGGPTAPCVLEHKANSSGFVTACDARVIGEIVRDLGGGRLTKDTVINPEVGIEILAKPGARVAAGDVLAVIHAASADDARSASTRLASAFSIRDAASGIPQLIAEVIG
jgi:pyrimidine-nucleoside phosphorylase